MILLIQGCLTFKEVKVDPNLEAARVKLMEGSITRDQSVIQPLLAPDFAWREDDAPLDEEPYDFWNRHKLWPQLGALLKENPVPDGDFMKAPKMARKKNYTGPRLGWRKVGDEWRLAFFFAGSAPAQ
ncbi:MAG: hypothetical protein EBS01_00405 [Verrucomicrobia bacterium]|nr:hypothetical protein [Verrucomicrobiota bacterium]